MIETLTAELKQAEEVRHTLWEEDHRLGVAVNRSRSHTEKGMAARAERQTFLPRLTANAQQIEDLRTRIAVLKLQPLLAAAIDEANRDGILLRLHEAEHVPPGWCQPLPEEEQLPRRKLHAAVESWGTRAAGFCPGDFTREMRESVANSVHCAVHDADNSRTFEQMTEDAIQKQIDLRNWREQCARDEAAAQLQRFRELQPIDDLKPRPKESWSGTATPAGYPWACDSTSAFLVPSDPSKTVQRILATRPVNSSYGPPTHIPAERFETLLREAESAERTGVTLLGWRRSEKIYRDAIYLEVGDHFIACDLQRFVLLAKITQYDSLVLVSVSDATTLLFLRDQKVVGLLMPFKQGSEEVIRRPEELREAA